MLSLAHKERWKKLFFDSYIPKESFLLLLLRYHIVVLLSFDISLDVDYVSLANLLSFVRTPVRACAQEKGRPEDGRNVVYKSVWALTEKEREERKTGGRLIYLLAFPPFSPSTDSSERWLEKDGEGLQTLASLFSVRFLLTGFPNHIGNEIASSCLHAPEAKIDLRNTSEKRKKKSFLSSILILRK